MFVAGCVIALYFVSFLSDGYDAGLVINPISVIVSAGAFLIAVVSYLWSPTKLITAMSLGVYVLLATTAGSLIATSGGLQSPFIALWILIAIFAGIFGLLGIVPMLVAGSMYLVLGFIEGTIIQDAVVTTFIAGWLPLVASYIIWHGRKTHEEGKDRAFRDLASELSEVASKAEVVINAIADGVIAVDNQGIIQLINPAAQEITGWGKQDATTLSYKSVLKLTDQKDQELDESVDPVLEVLSTNKEVERDDLSLTTHFDKKLLVSVTVSPVGQLGSGAIIVFRDITKEKAQEREQAEFISTASHEMRTPVASIEGYLGLTLNPATAQIDDKARDFITKAHQSAQHLGRLFQDLLDVSKADDGRLSNNPKVVDVVEFAHDIVEGLRPQADAKRLQLVYKPMPDDSQTDRHLSPVYYSLVDNDHLREIIANLTENAIKYTLKGDVVVDITGDNEHVTISVTDSGIGIPPEDIPHLFQKFYRVDTSETREIGGTGLGLYLCRRLAEIMGSRIWVESQYGKGSTFYLQIPRIDHEEATRLIEAALQPTEIVRSPSTFVTSQPAVVTPPVSAPASESLSGTVTSPPADVIARQLQSIQQPATLSQPTAPPLVNTPLSAIEQNPAQFIHPRGTAVVIPKRDEPS
ncbi:MAG: putative sensor protein [Candidatus Saccharibacteria bacterium]|nr:putative sensor protein [Candidatus Saccharibacteria bacterium]